MSLGLVALRLGAHATLILTRKLKNQAYQSHMQLKCYSSAVSLVIRSLRAA